MSDVARTTFTVEIDKLSLSCLLSRLCRILLTMLDLECSDCAARRPTTEIDQLQIKSLENVIRVLRVEHGHQLQSGQKENHQRTAMGLETFPSATNV